jgi:uncharacterized membrane protein (DUF485 family)
MSKYIDELNFLNALMAFISFLAPIVINTIYYIRNNKKFPDKEDKGQS